VRKFTAEKIDQKTIDSLIATTLTAPSSKNTRSTRIAYSDDKIVLAKVAAMRSTGSAFVKDAPLVFFIMGDESLADLWRENCAISATYLQLAAEDLGLGSCWVHVNGRPYSNDEPEGKTAEDYLRHEIPALAPYRILCAVAMGYPLAEPRPHEPRDDSDKIITL
jgi:nitroreductase